MAKPNVNPERKSGNAVTAVPLSKEAQALEQKKAEKNLEVANQNKGTRKPARMSL